jgi:glycosyltransferase involved in cell wall biosynthesis
MDLFAQPSVQQEGLPTAILEAEAAGLPILASDIGGTSETLEVGETGLLVPPGDAQALADAIAELSANYERCKRMGEAARRRIETHFSLDRMIDEVCAVYDQAMAAYEPKGSRDAGRH